MAASLGLARPKIAINGGFLRVLRRVVAYWRAVVVLLIFARAAAIVLNSQFVEFELVLLALLLIFIASQIFWVGRAVDLGERLLRGRVRRRRVATGVVLAYLFVVAYSFPTTLAQGHTFRIGFYRLPIILTEAVFWWWFVGSILGFLLVMGFGLVDSVVRAAAWASCQVHQTAPQRVSGNSEATSSSSRRQFLQQTAVLVSATPFVATGYGLLYERQDVEVVRQRVRLARLPKGFDGFRIAQLSDIHMGPFTPADYVRRCVAITNGLKPDLIVLTGDYIAWDPGAEREVVRVLAGLRAAQGVFGCLGNHEEESDTEDYVASLFAEQGIHILRQARAPIERGGEMLNLIGVDEPHGGRTEAEWRGDLHRKLQKIKELMMPGTVNILLAHGDFPRMFDRVADLGIDLMLAGHTHGGQLSLDFIHRGLNLGHLIYDYNSGWYEKNGAQLYVNRGIGTTGFPIRLGARPEITLFELTAA
jgi:predicted MPP superfamily phosphohydrolase